MPRVFPASLKIGKTKHPGVLVLDENSTVKWDAQQGSGPESLVIPLRMVKQLFATPPNKPNHLLKLTCGEQDKDEEINHMFGFTERPVLEEVKTLLQTAIKEQREPTVPTSRNETPVPQKKQVGDGLDNKSLLENFQLQHQILKDNKELADAFRGAVIDGGLSPETFWSTRLHILRPHALLLSQKRGAYNVLGKIKPTTTSDNQINLSVTREQIHDMFEQYPIVQQAYTDNVPPLAEGTFWQRFFMSKLFRRLRGEKISSTDAPDPLLDQYINADGNVKRGREEELDETDDQKSNKRPKDGDRVHVPQYLDIEGNEENSEKFDRVPDITMQPGKSSQDVVSLIQSMNNLSERMLHVRKGVGYQDKDESNLSKELLLDDLAGPTEAETFIDLELLNDNATVQNSTDSKPSKSFFQYTAESIEHSKTQFVEKIDLRKVGAAEDVKDAAEQIIALNRQRSKEQSDNLTYAWANTGDGDNGLMTQVMLCHAASIEFLKQFWTRFLSGDAAQAGTLATVAANLRKSLDRVNAVIEGAAVGKERVEVEHALSSLVTSITTALDTYDRAVAFASAQKV